MTQAAYYGSLRFCWTDHRRHREAAGAERKQAEQKSGPRRPKKDRPKDR